VRDLPPLVRTERQASRLREARISAVKVAA
jgi:hypothetical protein